MIDDRAEASKAGESSEAAYLSENVAEGSDESNLPSTSGELSEIDNFTENPSEFVTGKTGETATYISGEQSEGKNELSSDSQQERIVDGDLREFENSEAINLQASESASLNTSTVELDSTASQAQAKIDSGTEIKNDADQSDSPSKVEAETIDTSQKLAQQDVSSKTNEGKEKEPNTVAETVTEHPKQCVSEGVAVNENEVGSVVAQDTQVNEEVQSSQMYPKLDSVARETGTCIGIDVSVVNP